MNTTVAVRGGISAKNIPEQEENKRKGEKKKMEELEAIERTKNKIEQLQKQLEELEAIERTNDFIRLLRGVLLNDKCSIILQGHNEWQFNEKYLMKDITRAVRERVKKRLDEIEIEKENK
jgi:hypothetical protein